MSAAVRSFRMRWWAYRRLWRTGLMASFLQPMFTLVAIGLGVGAMVSDRAAIGGLRYVTFIGPGLLVSSCMMTGVAEGMWVVLDGFQWTRNYHSQAATPLTPRDIVRGHVLWVAVRVGIGAIVVAAVLSLLPATRSAGIVIAVPVGVLTALAFALPMTAYSATLERDLAYANINRFVVTPLYLFAGAFFPLSRLPSGLEIVAAAFPLWHGIELARGAMTSIAPAWPWPAHLAVLFAWCAGGAAMSYRTFENRLAA